MDTAAEGVETHDDLHLIRELGVQPGPGLHLRQARSSRGSARAGQQRHGRGRRLPVHPRAAPAADAPRHRRDRRTRPREIRLRNISAMGALVECDQPVAPGHAADDRHRRRRPGRRHRPLGPGRQVRRPVQRAVRPDAPGAEEAEGATTSRCFSPGTSDQTRNAELERLDRQRHHAFGAGLDLARGSPASGPARARRRSGR